MWGVVSTFSQPRTLIAGLFVLGLGIGTGLTLAIYLLLTFGPRGALATHDDPSIVHVCVNRFTGQARFVPDGFAPNCTANETLVELGSGGAVVDVEARVSALEDQVPDCLSTENGDAVFEGCNVHVRNGEDSTQSANALGNLIVGYNENSQNFDRGGSHNLVVGEDHGYSSFGGLVAGHQNVISGQWASVTGGGFNVASANFSSVSGGWQHQATGNWASVSGGQGNIASGFWSSVSGGEGNTASGTWSSISGGEGNIASGLWSSVTGGEDNTASGDYSSVNGGENNEAAADHSSVGGGTGQTNNTAGTFHAQGTLVP